MKRVNSLLNRCVLLLLVFCLLPCISDIAIASIDSPTTQYKSALDVLISADLTNGSQLLIALIQFGQAGSFAFGNQYYLLVRSLIMLCDKDDQIWDSNLERIAPQIADIYSDPFRFDNAFDNIDFLLKDPRFVEDYNKQINNDGIALPDLNSLLFYIQARKYEESDQVKEALDLYADYQVLDAPSRASALNTKFRRNQYENAIMLIEHNTLPDYLEAIEIFKALGSYGDSLTKKAYCQQQIDKLKTSPPTPIATKTPLTTIKTTVMPTIKITVKPTVNQTARPTLTPKPISPTNLWPKRSFTPYRLQPKDKGENRVMSFCGPSSTYPDSGAYKTYKMARVDGLFIENSYIMIDMYYTTVGVRRVYMLRSAFNDAGKVPQVDLTGFSAVTTSSVVPRYGPGGSYDSFDKAAIGPGVHITVFFEESGYVFAEFNCSLGAVRGWISVNHVKAL